MPGKRNIPVDGDELRRLYVVEQLTCREIAALLDIGSRTVSRRLQAFGIDARPPGPDRHAELRDAGWLRARYEHESMSTLEVGALIGASPRVVSEWLKQHGIQPRSRNQHAGKQWPAAVRERMSRAKVGKLTGESNPNWRGGLVNPNVRLRASADSKGWSQAVRNRDGKCVDCGAGGKLHAHHVKPWKNHPELRFDVSNGATLCPPCHQKAHGWRFPGWAYTAKPHERQASEMKDEDIV